MDNKMLCHFCVRNNSLRVFGKARVKGKPAKQYVKEQVEERFKPNGFIKMNKRGNPDKRNIDAYDALVCAFSSYKT